MNKQFSKEEIELDGTYGKFPNLTNESWFIEVWPVCSRIHLFQYTTLSILIGANYCVTAL